MSQSITLSDLRAWLLGYADEMDRQSEYLCELDAAIGDGDHGSNMVRGMERVRSRLLDGREEAGDIGDLLRAVAMTLISSIGGAAGPLYGAFFMHASREFAGCYELNVEQLAQLFRAGYEGVRQRGKASTGEKTMLDTLHPAVVAFEEAAARGESLTDGLGQAVLAAYDGMVQTREIEAKKGRASYLGLRSIGHQDPGATSAFYLVAALHQVKCPGEEPLAGRIAASEKE